MANTMNEKALPYTRETAERCAKELRRGDLIRDHVTGEEFELLDYSFNTGSDPGNTDPAGVLMCELENLQTGDRLRERFRDNRFDLVSDPLEWFHKATYRQPAGEGGLDDELLVHNREYEEKYLDTESTGTLVEALQEEWINPRVRKDIAELMAVYNPEYLSCPGCGHLMTFDDRRQTLTCTACDKRREEETADDPAAEDGQATPIVTAEDGKRLCPSCGSVLVYDTERQALVCGSCGFDGTGRQGYTEATDPGIVAKTAKAAADVAEKCETAAEVTEAAEM